MMNLLSQETLCWAVTLLLLVVGFFGTFLPLLPGSFLILAGAGLHHSWMPRINPDNQTVSLKLLLVLLGLFALSYLIEFFSTAVGAKIFGSSKWGVIGAIGGGLVGGFLFSLPGLLLGPLIGVFLLELIVKRKFRSAARSTTGTVIGSLAGMVLKTIIAASMIALFFADLYWF